MKTNKKQTIFNAKLFTIRVLPTAISIARATTVATPRRFATPTATVALAASTFATTALLQTWTTCTYDLLVSSMNCNPCTFFQAEITINYTSPHFIHSIW